MEVEFENECLAGIYHGQEIRGKPIYQQVVINKFIKTVNIIKAVPRIETMFQMNSLNYEKLSGNKIGLSSVRVTLQFRLEFREVTDPKGKVFKFTIIELSNHYK